MNIKDNILVNTNNQPIYFNMDILEPWVIDDFFKLCCETEHDIVTKIIDEAFEYWNAATNIRHCYNNYSDLEKIIKEIDKTTKPFDLNLINFQSVNGSLDFKFCISTKYKYLFSYLMLTNLYHNKDFVFKYNLIINGSENTLEEYSEFLISYGLQIIKKSNNA